MSATDDEPRESPDGVDGSGTASPVLDHLGDATCRTILGVLADRGYPMTAQEVAAATEVSLTSVYRKLDQLVAAGLVVDNAEVDPDGHRRTRYSLAADHIEVGLHATEGLDVTLFRAAAGFRPNVG